MSVVVVVGVTSVLVVVGKDVSGDDGWVDDVVVVVVGEATRVPEPSSRVAKT
jgi:hypothetical protein